MMHTIRVFNADIEITDKEVSEVISCQLEEQTVFIQRIRSISKEESEIHITIFRQSCLSDAITFIEGDISPVPHICEIEVGASQLTSGLHTIYYHSSHLADLALRIFRHHQLHSLKTAFRISIIKFCKTFYKYETVSVVTKWKALFRNLRITINLLESITSEGIISSTIQRVFQFLSESCIISIIWVCKKNCPLRLGIVLAQTVHTALCCRRIIFSRVKQEQMIVQLILWFKFRIVIHESVELLLTESQIIELILKDDTRMIQAVFYHLMSSSLRFVRERYLRQIVLSLMWIINSRIQTLFFLLLCFFYSSKGVALLISHHFETVCLKNILYNSLVVSSPVINIFTFTPQALECLLSLQYCLRVIEIPCCRTTLVHDRHRGSSILVKVTVVGIFLLQLRNRLFGFQSLLLFLLLPQFRYHPVDSSISSILIRYRKFEKRVLQLYSISIWHQFVEHLRTI